MEGSYSHSPSLLSCSSSFRFGWRESIFLLRSRIAPGGFRFAQTRVDQTHLRTQIHVITHAPVPAARARKRLPSTNLNGVWKVTRRKVSGEQIGTKRLRATSYEPLGLGFGKDRKRSRSEAGSLGPAPLEGLRLTVNCSRSSVLLPMQECNSSRIAVVTIRLNQTLVSTCESASASARPEPL